MAYTFQFPSRQQAKSTTPDKVKLDERAVNSFYAAMLTIEEHEAKEALQLLQRQIPSLKVTR